MGEQVVSKVCVKCGQNVADRPRVKDLKGRYFCKPCAASLKAGAGGAAGGPAGDEGDVLAAMIGEAAPAGEGCPGCGGAMASGAVICTRCGFNRQSGRRIHSVVQEQKKEPRRAAKEPKPEREPAGPASPLEGALTAFSLGTVLGIVGGIVGGAVWYAVAMWTGYEYQWMTILVGVTTGAGVRLAFRDGADSLSGVLAASLAVVAVLIARWVVIEQVVDELAAEGLEIDAGSAYMVSFGIHGFMFLIIGAVAAFSIGSGIGFGDDD